MAILRQRPVTRLDGFGADAVGRAEAPIKPPAISLRSFENRHDSLVESLSPTNGEKPTCFHDDHYTR
jgi:hypothetical protein